jgi:hypothetical protein
MAAQNLFHFATPERVEQVRAAMHENFFWHHLHYHPLDSFHGYMKPMHVVARGEYDSDISPSVACKARQTALAKKCVEETWREAARQCEHTEQKERGWRTALGWLTVPVLLAVAGATHAMARMTAVSFEKNLIATTVAAAAVAGILIVTRQRSVARSPGLPGALGRQYGEDGPHPEAREEPGVFRRANEMLDNLAQRSDSHIRTLRYIHADREVDA